MFLVFILLCWAVVGAVPWWTLAIGALILLEGWAEGWNLRGARDRMKAEGRL